MAAVCAQVGVRSSTLQRGAAISVLREKNFVQQDELTEEVAGLCYQNPEGHVGPRAAVVGVASGRVLGLCVPCKWELGGFRA